MPRAWDQDLPQAEFAYNSTINNSTNMSPFSTVCRKVPNHLLDLTKLSICQKFSNATSAIVKQAKDAQKEVQTRLETNARYKAAVDKKSREEVFEEGDMIMVYLIQESIPAGSYNKLKPKNRGRKICIWSLLI